MAVLIESELTETMNRTSILSVTLLTGVSLFSAENTLPQTPHDVNELEHLSAPVIALRTRIVPPPMPRRSIAPSTNAVPGDSVVLEDNGTKFTLFIPRGWTASAPGKASVTVHFHTTPWFVIQEHVRRGAKEPLICFQLGEGSTVYRQAFEDSDRFGRVLRVVESELKKRGAPSLMQITAVDISSFSAGYGAVRELIKSPQYFKIIRRIVLLDSMYAGYEDTPGDAAVRRPVSEHIDVWIPFARAAMRGNKTFVFTHSAVPTGKYASSAECATALLRAVGAHGAPIQAGSCPAASDPEFPLRYRADAGNFHVWGYAGEDAQAHLTHARHMADVWIALDE